MLLNNRSATFEVHGIQRWFDTEKAAFFRFFLPKLDPQKLPLCLPFLLPWKGFSSSISSAEEGKNWAFSASMLSTNGFNSLYLFSMACFEDHRVSLWSITRISVFLRRAAEFFKFPSFFMRLCNLDIIRCNFLSDCLSKLRNEFHESCPRDRG